MCFVQMPDMPEQAPPTPSSNAEDARRRRREQAAANEAQQGRAATILTSPLGDPNYGQNINRTTLVGL